MLKSHKNQREGRPSFLLTASYEGPLSTPCPFSAEAEKNVISLSYTSRCKGVVKPYSHFKIEKKKT